MRIVLHFTDKPDEPLDSRAYNFHFLVVIRQIIIFVIPPTLTPKYLQQLVDCFATKVPLWLLRTLETLCDLPSGYSLPPFAA